MKRFLLKWFMEAAIVVGTIIAWASIGIMLAWRG